MARNNWHLKHRPFQLSEVVGQENVVLTLKNSSISNRFANSYFFVGNKGSGKTSTARILANLVNCDNVQDGVLCGVCPACQKIPNNTSLDVIELDGAANGNVEKIQELIEGAQWSPNEFKKKVYIIDEAHQLSAKAISALLKIVEEPPEYLMFIFCTTEPKKIIDTIPSRSQRFNFKRLTSKQIFSHLEKISKKESINYEDGALFQIAQISRGCMRDALVILEQIYTSAYKDKLTEQHVYNNFGIPDRKIIFNIVESIVSGNISLVMDQVNDIIMSNADLESIAYEISELFRSIMIIKAQSGNYNLIDLPSHEIDKIKVFSEKIKMGHLDKMSKQFSTLKKELAYSINERWVLESTLIHCIALIKQ